MEYYEQLTFTGKGDVEEAEETAIKLIREFEELALRRCPDKGYIVGYSGGKDSDCLVDLFFRAGVKFTIIHNHLLYNLIEEKVTKLIAENKDVIIDRAANMVADSASLKKALDMIAVELNMKEEATK